MSAVDKYYQEGISPLIGLTWLSIAANAAGPCKEDGFSIDAHIAQIMAAVAAEAFISEFAFVLASHRLTGKGAELARVGAILEQLEASRIQVTEKFNIASQLLPGKPYNAGSQPFQSFVQLIRLRNYLAHPKVLSQPPGWFSFFVNNGLVTQGPDTEHPIPFWTFQLQNKRSASWACRAAARIILDIIDRLEYYGSHEIMGIKEIFLSSWEWARTDTRIWTGGPLDRI